MKFSGMIRRFDDLRRIVIPKEVMKLAFGRSDMEGVPMEIYYDHGKIILKRKDPTDIWGIDVNKKGEIEGFVCSCGWRSKQVTNFCPHCGQEKDNADIDNRIDEAIVMAKENSE